MLTLTTTCIDTLLYSLAKFLCINVYIGMYAQHIYINICIYVHATVICCICILHNETIEFSRSFTFLFFALLFFPRPLPTSLLLFHLLNLDLEKHHTLHWQVWYFIFWYFIQIHFLEPNKIDWNGHHSIFTCNTLSLSHSLSHSSS